MSETAVRAQALAVALVAALGVAGTRPAAAAAPAVARAHYADTKSSGVVFFVAARSLTGAAAVGTAHNVDLAALTAQERVTLQAGASRTRLAESRGLLAPPGRPFNAPGGSLAGDFVVYALEAPPTGARVLELQPEPPGIGDRVVLLGIARGGRYDEQRVEGRVVGVSATRVEVDLDAPYDLRGWGGAPLVSGSERVIGFLQANRPQGNTSRVFAAPVGELRRALEAPLAGGAGVPFARFSQQLAEQRKVAETSPAGNGDGAREDRRPIPEPLLRQGRKDGTRVHLNVEFPPDGAIVSDSLCGAFVAGRALALQGELRRFDVILVLDTSQSTDEPTGADINGNGVIGEPRLGPIGSLLSTGSTDPGDSILAAEVLAARQLLRGLDPRSTRVGVVVFAGDPPGSGGGLFSRQRPPAVTLQPLTTAYRDVEIALDNVLSRGPSGSTHMALGVDQATTELLGFRGALSRKDPESEKVVFFFTDGQPTLPFGPQYEADNIRAVLRAARRAQRGGIRIHSFAVGPEALAGPLATVEMASITDGFFTPVRHPADLIDVVEQVSFSRLESITVKSRTTGEPADPFRSTADGTWGGFVKMVPGKNEIEIQARADDGTQAVQVVKVDFVPDAPSPAIPADLVVQRNRLLEDCLREAKRLRLEAEQEHAEEVRKQLLVEIEKERAKARERATDQRKRLDLEVESEDE